MTRCCTATELRKRFRDIPKDQRETHQPFAIRVWRGLSWLERAEQAAEVEDQFIALWIAFNALYGRQDEESRVWSEKKAWMEFLGSVWRMDANGLLRSYMRDRQTVVLGIIGNKFLSREFWESPGGDGHDKRLHAEVRSLLPRFGEKNLFSILATLFDRLYIMRVQLFHGASTKGSSLNRRTLKQCTVVLADMIPILLAIMIENGIGVDWGGVCFPPIK